MRWICRNLPRLLLFLDSSCNIGMKIRRSGGAVWLWKVRTAGVGQAPQQRDIIRPYYHCVCGQTLLENTQ